MSFERQTEAIEVSVVIPCLNEEDTLARCVEKARRALREHNIAGEIVVADNGSTDSSRAIAERQGTRVIMVNEPGYGSALMGGIAVATGRFVIIGDADDSYDFLEIPKIVEKLREGFDLVQGCRLPAGGGSVRRGAMPFLHRWVGNPFFSFLVRKWFNAPINDVYCGLRGFTKAMYRRLDQRCTGMEFATEMIIKASLHGEKIAEVPITLYPDRRTSHAPHLKTFRDGWRTFRYFLMCSPRRLFLVPGSAFIAFGQPGYLMRIPVDSLCHLRQDICHHRGTPSTRPAVGTLFRVCDFGKRAGRSSAGDARGWQFAAGCHLAMVADWFWPFGLRPHDAIRRARSDARRPGVSNRLLQLFRQHSWDAPQMNLLGIPVIHTVRAAPTDSCAQGPPRKDGVRQSSALLQQL